MNRLFKNIFIAVLSGLLACGAIAADMRVALPERPALIIPLPVGWRGQVRRAAPELPPTVLLSSITEKNFQILVTPIWSARADAKPLTPEFLRAMVAAAAEKAKPQAVEAELPVRELSGQGLSGAYFSATDRAPKSGEYRNLTQGMVAIGELQVGFTILSNGDAAAVNVPALQMLQSLRRE
ncbi:hypothetical protein ACEN8I_09140 [Polaromonas sp. CT11-55]|uniref:hypothetical protein n=1 Tax=Polaromonas sp. CT11-55 TaxID=3243045 RepID=UPI0039A4BC0F